MCMEPRRSIHAVELSSCQDQTDRQCSSKVQNQADLHPTFTDLIRIHNLLQRPSSTSMRLAPDQPSVPLERRRTGG